MATGGPNMWCPNCKKVTNCKAMPLYKFGKSSSRNWRINSNSDIIWFRRIRQCQECNESFTSAETEEALLSELFELRTRVASKNKESVSKALHNSPWLKGTDEIPRSLAAGLIQNSAWWLTHSSGTPVRAPGHASNLKEGQRGWVIEFGANSFLVGLALKRCREEIIRNLELAENGKLPLLSDLKLAIRRHLRSSVANFEGYEYDSYYPETNGQLVFGAQAINLNDAVNFILNKASVGDLFI